MDITSRSTVNDAAFLLRVLELFNISILPMFKSLDYHFSEFTFSSTLNFEFGDKDTVSCATETQADGFPGTPFCWDSIDFYGLANTLRSYLPDGITKTAITVCYDRTDLEVLTERGSIQLKDNEISFTVNNTLSYVGNPLMASVVREEEYTELTFTPELKTAVGNLFSCAVAEGIQEMTIQYHRRGGVEEFDFSSYWPNDVSLSRNHEFKEEIIPYLKNVFDAIDVPHELIKAVIDRNKHFIKIEGLTPVGVTHIADPTYVFSGLNRLPN